MFVKDRNLMTFLAITLFYFFEAAQMSYFNVIAPGLKLHGISYDQISAISAAYYYGDMIGLLPAGFALDRFELRKVLLWAILGSIVGASLLLVSDDYYVQWVARFICGFFGGTFSFIGGIRVLAGLFQKRFTFFMGLFLSAGMFGGLICQYPLLMAVNHFGMQGATSIMVIFGTVVMFCSVLFLYPIPIAKPGTTLKKPWRKTWVTILKNYRNWGDCLMVVLLDTPVSIIGTLWGVVILMNVYHFSDITSTFIVMSLFLGLMIGLPLWGIIADKYNESAWIIIVGAGMSAILCAFMLWTPKPDPVLIGGLFFGLGFFSSCQTLGFTWLTRNMQPEIIGQNSAFNSMIFMGTNGGFKQLGGYLLASLTVIKFGSSAANLLGLILISMAITVVYAIFRHTLFPSNQPAAIAHSFSSTQQLII
ncbi:MAG: MFS transporter [Tatlockia sp.]|nr:MFS transporter [Tatlockia sp.]